jgi:hypothetical protein
MKTKTLLFILFSALSLSISAQWTSVGSLWFSDSSRTFPRIANFQNKPLVSFGSAKDSLIDAYIFDNGTWQQFGQPNFAKGHSYFSRMIVYNDSVYFSYRDLTLAPRVSKYANGVWDSLGLAGPTNGNGIYPIMYKDTLFTLFTSQSSGNRLQVGKYSQTSGWTYNPLASISLTSGSTNSYATKWGDSLFVLFNEPSSLNLYKYFNGIWSLHSSLGIPTPGTPQMSLKVNPTTNSLYAFVHYSSSFLWSVKKLTGSTWQNVGSQSTITVGSSIFNIEMEFVNGVPVVIYQNSSIVTCKKFNGINAWIDYGAPSIVPDLCDNVSMTIIGDTIFAIMRRKSDSKISVVKWTDINNAATIIAPTTLTVCAGISGLQIPIKIRDESTTTLTWLTATSSNTTLVSNSNISISGTDSTRLLNVSLTNGIFGNTTIAFSVTDNVGNISQAFIQVNTSTPQTPYICEVTVDSSGVYNEIYWEKSMYPEVDSFIVYRETSTGIYKRIGSTFKTDLCVYVDTNRSIGPNNGDPNLTSYKYKLALKDTCGNLSAMSPWHQTLFIQDQQNGNFNWNVYAIEGASATPVSNYTLVRRDIAVGTETVVGNTSGNLFTDPFYALLASSGNIIWYVDASGFNCDPTQRVAAQKVKTKSNHANDLLITKTLESNFKNSFKIYPNPAKEMLTIELSSVNEKMSIEFSDVLGRILFTADITQNINTINTSEYVRGIYFIKCLSNNKIVSVKKVVLE